MSSTDRAVHRCECSVCRNGSEEQIVRYHRQVNLLLSRLNEAQRRWYVGVLSVEPNQLSDVELSLITGLDEKTIRRGRRELQGEVAALPEGRQRHPGGGRLLSEKKIQPWNATC